MKRVRYTANDADGNKIQGRISTRTIYKKELLHKYQHSMFDSRDSSRLKYTIVTLYFHYRKQLSLCFKSNKKAWDFLLKVNTCHDYQKLKEISKG